MADKYWVGGTGNWSDATNHWATSSGGSPGAGNTPGAGDNVYFDDNSFTASGQYVTVNATANCLDMVWGYSITSWNANLRGSSALNIYGILTFHSAMATNTYSGTCTFKATGTGKTIYLAGNTLATVVFNGVGGGWTLTDVFNCTGNFTVTAGTFASGNYQITCASFTISGSTTRTVTLGSSNIYCTTWSAGTTTGLTFTANTATIYLTSSGSDFAGGALTYGGSVIFTVATPYNTYAAISGAFTLENMTFVYGSQYRFVHTTTYTIKNIYGDGDTLRHIYLYSSAAGSKFTLSTSATVTRDYYRIKDCTKAGAGSITITHGYDESGNTGITFTNAYNWNTVYWIGGSGNWSDTANWAIESGGSGGAQIPTSLYAINVVFDVNSFDASSQTVTMDIAISCHDFTINGVLHSPTNTATDLIITGSFTADGSFNWVALTTATFSATTSETITSSGTAIATDITFSGSGTWTLQDNFKTLLTSSSITFSAGTFVSDGKTIDCAGTMNLSGSTTRTINISNSVVNCRAWTNTTVTGETLTVTGSTINVTLAGTGTFAGGGKTYNDVNFYVNTLTVTGTNTFANIGLSGGKTHKFPNTGTTTLTGAKGLFGINCSSSNKAILSSSTAANDTAFSKTSGTVSVFFFSIQDCTMSGGATFNAYGSTNVSGNTGWNFLRGWNLFPDNLEMLLAPTYEFVQANSIEFAPQVLETVDAGLNMALESGLDPNAVISASGGTVLAFLGASLLNNAINYVVFDNNGIMYICVGWQSGNKIYYSSDTTYTSFSEIASYPNDWSGDAVIAFDGNNDLHVTWTWLSYSLYYIKYSKFSGGSWSAPKTAGGGNNEHPLGIVLDANNVVNIITYGISFPRTGVYTVGASALITSADFGANSDNSTICVDYANDINYLVVGIPDVGSDYPKLYKSINAGSNWSAVGNIYGAGDLGNNIGTSVIKIDDDGVLHYAGFEDGSPYTVHYCYSEDAGVTWRDKITFTPASQARNLCMVAVSKRDVVISYQEGTSGHVFIAKRSRHGWNEPIDTGVHADTGGSVLSDTVSPTGRPYIAYVLPADSPDKVYISELIFKGVFVPPEMVADTAKMPTPTLSVVNLPWVAPSMNADTAKMPTPTLSFEDAAQIVTAPSMNAITAKIPTPTLNITWTPFGVPEMKADTAKMPTPTLGFVNVIVAIPPVMKAISARLPTPNLISRASEIHIVPYTMRCLRARVIPPIAPGFVQPYTYSIEILEFQPNPYAEGGEYTAEADTSDDTIYITGHDLYANDMIVNTTRRTSDVYGNRGSRRVYTRFPGVIGLNEGITDQAEGDSIRLYKYIDRTGMLRPGTFRLLRRGAGQSQLDFTIVTDASYIVKKGQYVRVVAVYNGSASYAFWGVVVDHSEQLVGAGQTKIYQTVSCQSLSTILTRRSIEIDETEGATYGSIVQKMVDNYLYSESITAGTIDAGATLTEDWSSEVISIGEVLDECASKSGYQWFVDDNHQLQFYQEPVSVPDASHEIRQDLGQSNVWRNYFNLKFESTGLEYFNKLYFAGGKDENGNDIVLYRIDLTEMNAQQELTAGTGVFGNIQRDTSLVETDYKTCESGSSTTTINITAHGQAVGDVVWNYTKDEYREVLTKPSNDQFTVAAFSGMTANSSASAEAGTTTTNIKITAHGISADDAKRGVIIYNSTRSAYRWVLSVVDADNFTVSSVASQTNGDTIEYSGDIIAFFDKINDKLQALQVKQSVEPTQITFGTPESFDPLTKLLVDLPELGRVDQYFLIEDVEIIDLGAGLSKCWYNIKGTRRNNSSFSSQRKLSYRDYWRDF